MKKFPVLRSSTTAIVIAVLAATFGATRSAQAFQASAHRSGIVDVEVRTAKVQSPVQAAERGQSVATLKQQVAGAEVTFDSLLGTPKFIRAQDGFLTGSNGVGRGVSALAASNAYLGEPDRALRLFLDEHSGLFGFGAEALASAQKTRNSVGKANGLRTMVWEQQLNGVPVFDSKLVANISKGGELVNVASRFVPGLSAIASRMAVTPSPALPASQAIASALAGMGESLGQGESVLSVEAPAGNPYESFTVRNRKTHARLVWLPMDRDTVRLAWEIYVHSRVRGEAFQVLVDANSGATLVRKNLTRSISDATYNIYPSDSPSPFSPGWSAPNAGQPALVNRTLITTNAFSITASPNGWINDGDNETRGNNADVYVDRDFDGQPDSPRPQGNPARTFDFPLDLTQDPLTYSNAAVVQMFYKMNVYHDLLYELGFTEADGNYQRDNFSRGGLGNDEIICYAQAGADVGASDNAFFSAAPDGINGEIAMFVWSGPNPQRDGDLDSEVIFHEATHGTSWRLVGGGMGLGNLQGDGMGEGWSDFYAESLLSEPADDPDAVYPMGGYPTYLLDGLTENYYYGIRHFPCSTDMTKNPFTYKDIDPTQISSHPGVPRSPIYPYDPTEASEVHHQGEIWFAMLWEVRANLIHRHGAAGNMIMLQLVTDGLKITPASPTFVEARDAILLADQVNNGGANINDIWRGFAKRGLGVGAISPDSDSTTGVVESYSTPGLQWVSTSVLGGNGNGMIDPNECNDLYVTVTNAGGVTATSVKLTLSCSTPGVFVMGSTVSVPVFPAGAVLSNLGPFRVSSIPEFGCGAPVNFTLGVKSQQGVNASQFQLQTGVLGSQVRFDSLFAVPIPDANPAGASSSITVANVTGSVGKVAVSLYLQHTFDMDLILELISPDGTTNLLAANVGFSGNNFGAGCSPDTLRTTFDDAAATSITAGTAPFVGAYRPEVPLANFKGKSGAAVNGTWQLHVVDMFSMDVGIIQCWSLLLDPVECMDGGGHCPGTDLALAMTDLPDPVAIGSNLVYTLTVTNLGPPTAKGTIVTHNLPGSVVYVSATTTRGSVSHAGGVVTANLGNLTNGATATIMVTVLPLVAGSIISTATVFSTEPEINPPNNDASVTTLVQSPSADLAISLAGAPNPTVVGGSLVYTATVRNNGPSSATGVVITNTLPGSVLVSSASSSQGSVSINGNTVICLVGSLTNGATAIATIYTTPLTAGTIFATSRVVGNLVDPVLANNVVTISTGVGEAADLGISIVDQPDPVVVNSNFTYTVTVTNRGPNVATAVVVNQSLPASLTVVSSNVFQGSVTVGGGTAVWSLGSLPVGGTAAMSIVGRSAVTGTLNTTASVNGAQADPNPDDNTASAATLVATPFVNIVAAGASLKTESFVPANGAIDAGETVSIDLRLRNAGNIPNNNVVATLLPTGGVTSPSGPQTYGVLPPGGLPVATNFTFTAGGTNGGTITATLQISDGGNLLSNVVFTFALPRQFNFTNPAAITIPSIGNASPYPSTIVVSGVTGTVGQVTATLSNFAHTYPKDVAVLLVGPTGQKVILMAAAGDKIVTNTTVTFSDTAAQPVPEFGPIFSGSYQPASYDLPPSFPAPAPVAPYSSGLSTFANANPNGTWSLYIIDRTTGDAGFVASGWRLGISLITPVNNIADVGIAGSVSPSPGLVGESPVWTISITNRGPNAANGVVVSNRLSAGLVLQSASSSPGVVLSTNGGLVVCSLGALGTNGMATVTIMAKSVSAGVASVTATVAASDIDLNAANNTAVVAVNNNLPLADLGVGVVGAPASAILGSNLVLTVTATNHGSGKALGTVLTAPLAAGVSFSSAILSKGSFAISNNSVICAFGDLVSDETVSASIVVTVTNSMTTLTNLALVATQSSDTNSANNQAAVVVFVSNPRPIIVASGATMVSEGINTANGAVDPGETITVALALANIGQLPTVSLNATLLASGGVGSPGGPQNYGALVPDGPTVSRNFTFTAPNTPGGSVTATLQLVDNGSSLGSVTFVFALSRITNFANATPITIPDRGLASPYPSGITVSGVTGVVGQVTVSLKDFSHAFPTDVDALLVGPQGQQLMLMSDAGGGYSVTNLNLGFDDGAASGLPGAAELISGLFQPTDFETGDVMPAPAPSGVRSSHLSAFNGTDPNGLWSLYVVDDSSGDAGTIAGGWALSITTIDPIGPLANLGIIAAGGTPAEVLTEEFVTYSIQITNRGSADAASVTVTDILPFGAIFDSATQSQGDYSLGVGLVTFNLGALSAAAEAQVTVRARQTTAGNAVNTITVTATQTMDLDSSDNAASVTTLVVNAIPASLEGVYNDTDQVFEIFLTGQSGATYVLQSSPDLGSWTPVATNTAPANGTLKFTDSASAAIAQRFYRAVRQLP